MFRDYKQNNDIKIHSLITTSTFCIYQWDIMLPVNTVHVYMCTIIPTLNFIQSPCLHLAVIIEFIIQNFSDWSNLRKNIYTHYQIHIFFFTVKYYTCASIQKSACSVRHSINTHPCPETKSILIPTPPPPHTIKPRIS